MIAFYHRQLAERVAGRFLAGGEAQARHRDLARYFSKTAWLDEGRKTPNTRRAAELVFQQREAQQWRRPRQRFRLPVPVCQGGAGMVLDLDADYQALLQEAPETELLRRDDLRLMQGTLRLSLYVLAKDRGQFASQMTARLLGHQDEPAMAAFLKEVDTFTPRPRLWPLWPELEAPGGPLLRIMPPKITRTLPRHVGLLDGSSLVHLHEVAVPADPGGAPRAGHLLQARHLPSGAAAPAAWRKSSGSRATIRPVIPGRPEGNQPGSPGYRVAGPEGLSQRRKRSLGSMAAWPHGRWKRLALSADGKRSVSGSWDQTVRVWDLEGNHLPRILEGHTGCVAAVALSGDGMRAISGSFDCTLRIWIWRATNQLASLKATRVGSKPWRCRPTEWLLPPGPASPFRSPTTRLCGFGIWRATSHPVFWRTTGVKFAQYRCRAMVESPSLPPTRLCGFGI